MPRNKKLSRIGSHFFTLLFVAMVYYVVQFEYGLDADNYEYESYNRRLATGGTGDDALVSSAGHARTFKIFGGMEQLKTEQATVSFIIVICLVVFLENFFHEIHSITHDTPFADMVSAIEKELMIVGFMAFALKVIVATTSFLSLDW